MEQELSGIDQIKIRAAVPADIENIVRVVNDAFGPERFFIDGDRTNPEKIRALFQKGKNYCSPRNRKRWLDAFTSNYGVSEDILACCQ